MRSTRAIFSRMAHNPRPVESGSRLKLLNEAARLWIEAGGGVIPTSGRSMRPTFEDASRVWLGKPHRVRFGDILVYTNGGILVVHRVVRVHRGPRFRTKGDGLPHLDRELVHGDQVLGRVVSIERGGERYSLEELGGRVYARLAAAFSSLEGFFYRFAWRLDRLLTPRRHPEASTGGRTTLRRGLARAGRLGIGLLDRALFRRLHSRML